MLTTIDPALGPLLAHYARGAEGAAVVLTDGMLEKSGSAAITISDDDEPAARIDNVVLVLSAEGQKKLGARCVKQALDRIRTKLDGKHAQMLDAALAALDGDTGGTAEEAHAAKTRQEVFQVWRSLSRANAAREVSLPVWAIWMLMRDMPLVALTSLRSIDEKQTGTQIETIAQMLS